MSTSSSALAPAWTVRYATVPSFSAVWSIPETVGMDWQPLGQAWREQPEADFNAGWARLRWHSTGLLVEGVFRGQRQANSARRLNERTWELGSVFELFLRAEGYDGYLELHVTPENQRLQLTFPDGGIESFRAGRAALEDFFVHDPTWVTSETRIADNHWAVRVALPFRCLGLTPGSTLPPMRAAVCRYDLARGHEVLSSTARLPAPDYHQHAHWSRLQFVG